MLKTLTLRGFKSFADQTRLEFGAGVCAVIGPNGSGKSNVVEALRWATHGARARELRAGRGTELIFHGSSGKAPLGLAEVQLELHTASGRLSLARRVYRDGSAEQDLNGRSVRVKDIQTALRGTGLGPGGLAVIGQGEVSGVVQAEGRTLLGYVQEAAGLSRAVNARQEAEARLSEVDAQVIQLRLLLDERQSTVFKLAQAAYEAREHTRLSQLVNTLEEALRRDKQLQLRRELAQAQAELVQLEGRSQQLSAEVQQQASELEAARERAQEAKAQLETHRAALETLQAARSAQQQAQRYLERLQQEAAQLQQELAELVCRAPAEPAPDLDALAEQVRVQRQQAQTAEQEARRLEKALSAQQAQAQQAAQAQARRAAQLEALEQQLQQSQTALAALEIPLMQAREALEEHAQRRQALEARFLQLSAERQQLQSRERQQQQRQAEQQAALGPLRRERERLEQSLNSYARYGEGARNALRRDHPGIVGSVADLLSFPAEYETALQAALGRRLEQVVVRTAEDAREIIEELKRAGGRATFLPLELLRARPRRDVQFLGQAGVLGNLADLCPTDPPQVGEALLSDTLLVQDLALANRLARQHAQRPRLVTVQGEVLEPGGAITGGRLRDNGNAILADQRRFSELDEEVSSLETGLNVSQTELKQLAERLQAAQPLHDQVLKEREAAVLAERLAEQKLRDQQAEQQSCQRQREQLQRQLDQAPVSVALTAELDWTALEQQLQQQRLAAEQLREAERAALEAQALGRELAALWSAYTQAQVRRQTVQARLSENAATSQAQQEQLSATAADLARREADLRHLDLEALPQAEAQREQVAQAYTRRLGQQNQVRARLEELRLLLARREAGLEDLAPGCTPAGTTREWHAGLNRARAELSTLGPINARAEHDHAQELELLRDQEAEIHDAEAATQELRLHLRQLEEQERQATEAAYQRVNQAFIEYSQELLGGEGLLDSERDQRGQLCGLKLAVQPKGKRTRSMTLLSAGERTMAGLAFLFALNHAAESLGGLPLAVLDEVDAPLDEANIRRFTSFLERFAARGTQFILITHQKATMEVAQLLWGVTTDASGASRVLSIKQELAG